MYQYTVNGLLHDAQKPIIDYNVSIYSERTITRCSKTNNRLQCINIQ